MSRFLLHRLKLMEEHSPEANLTRALWAAGYLHRITCYEREPKKYGFLKRQLPGLREDLAEFLHDRALDNAQILKAVAERDKKPRAGGACRRSRIKPVRTAPERVVRINAQYGWNWVLLDWVPAGDRRNLWGYRVYRTDKQSPAVLVDTVAFPEALLVEQPERVKLYYYITVFNGAGESPPSGDFGLMLPV